MQIVQAISIAVSFCTVSLSAQEQASLIVLSDLVNREIPRWLTLSGEERVRVESFHGAGFGEAGDGYLLNRLRLDLGVRPTVWLRFQ